MTVPEELVKAAALALEATNDSGYAVSWDTLARAALTAAFAKLPECEALAVTCVKFKDGEPCSRFFWDYSHPECVLATLAHVVGQP